MSSSTIGLLLAFGTHAIWGSFPLFIEAAKFASPSEIVTWRVIWGFVFAVIIIVITGKYRALWVAIKNPRQLLVLAVAAILIYLNWLTYVIAISTGHVIESALGYFINPLVIIALAVIVLREKLRPLQWVALSITAVAVTILTIDYGRFPIIALALALSFGGYSLLKSKLGGKISALNSFTIESGLLMPIAIIQLVITGAFVPIQFGAAGFWPSMVLVVFGFMTAVPLIMFGAAASRVPLSTLGFLQYLTPTFVLFLGIYYFGEEMPAVRLLGFAIVWLGLGVLTADALAYRRRNAKIIAVP